MKLATSLSVKRTRSGSTASEIPTMPHLPGEEPVASTSIPKPTPPTATRPRQKRGGGRKTVQVTDLGGAGDVDEGEIKYPYLPPKFSRVVTVLPPKRQSRTKGEPPAASRCDPTCVHHQDLQAAMKGEGVATTTPKLTPDQQVTSAPITTRIHMPSLNSPCTPRGVYRIIWRTWSLCSPQISLDRSRSVLRKTSLIFQLNEASK